MNPTTIRSIIFLIAGLVCIVFPEKLMKMQDIILTKIHVKKRDSKKATMTLGIVFLVVAVVLFVVSMQ